MLTALLEKDLTGPDIIQAYFLQALYWSLGAGLLEDGRLKFDRYIKYISALPEKEPDSGQLAGPGKTRTVVNLFDEMRTRWESSCRSVKRLESTSLDLIRPR